MSFYDDIKQKKGYVVALAPMEGVTDTVFRQSVCRLGRPDFFLTEFMSTEGYCSNGRDGVVHRLEFDAKEKPIVIQLWGNVPEYYAKTIEDVKKLNPDGIDVNFGCSVRDVLASGRGAALIQEKGLVKEILDVVKEAAGDIPVSVKTRLGYDDIDVDGWIGFLLEQGLDLITIHGRSTKMSYGVPADWDSIAKCVKLRNEVSPTTLIIGNGDVKSAKQGEEYVRKYGVDGYMIGRAVLNNPWVFSGREDISKEERFDALVNHLELFEKVWKDTKPFSSQKKYIKAYIGDFEGANELRVQLMACNSLEDVKGVLEV